MRPTRLGIIGCGSVLEAYAPQAERLRGKAELVVACGRERQRAAAEAFGIPRFTTRAEEVTQSPDVDLVAILTPPSTHASLARAALEAGKHVLVEKTMATTLEEGAELLALARKGTAVLMPAPFTALSPTLQTIARRVRRGDVGRVVSARGRYGWAGPGWGKWFYRPGGGPIIDLAVYNITSLTAILGSVRRVLAATGVAIPEREVNGERLKVEVEDNAHILLEFECGTLAAVTTGFTIQQYRCPALELYGTDGTIQMLGDDWDPEGYELWQNPVGAWQVYKETAPDWPWTDGLRHLVECVREGATPLVTAEHAFHVLEIVLQAQASGKEGRALSVQSRFTPPDFPGEGAHGPAHLIHDRTRASEQER